MISEEKCWIPVIIIVIHGENLCFSVWQTSHWKVACQTKFHRPFKKCEKFTSSLTAGFFNELLVEAYQLGREVDLVRGNPPELKCFQGFFSHGFQCHIVRGSALKAFSRCGIDMAYD